MGDEATTTETAATVDTGTSTFDTTGDVSDEEYDDAWAVLRGEKPAEPAKPTTPPPAEVKTPTPPAKQEQGKEAAPKPGQDPAKPEGQQEPAAKQPAKPDGGGDLKVAVHQLRQENGTLKRELEAIKANQQKASVESEKQANQTKYEELLRTNPEKAEAFAQELADRERETERKAIDAERQGERMQLSVDYAKATYGEEVWSNTLQHLSSVEESVAEHLGGSSFINWDAIKGTRAPALVAMQIASLFPTREQIDAEIQAGITAGVEAEMAKLRTVTTPQQPRAPRSIAAIPAAAEASQTKPRDVSDLSQEEVDALSDADFEKWKEKALRPQG